MPVVGSTPSQRDPKGRYSNHTFLKSNTAARWEGLFWPLLVLEVKLQFSHRWCYMIHSWSVSAAWIWDGPLPANSSVKTINNCIRKYLPFFEKESKVQACTLSSSTNLCTFLEHIQNLSHVLFVTVHIHIQLQLMIIVIIH